MTERDHDGGAAGPDGEPDVAAGAAWRGPLRLLDLSYPGLEQLMAEWGEPRFRARQLWQWIYSRLCERPEEMANLPYALRERLAEQCQLGGLEPLGSATAEDQLTQKMAFRTADGHAVETVLMHYAERHTLCISSQVGCPVGCPFCATGQQGWARDLTVGEITAQVLHLARALRKQNASVTNVVFMGMGEPMLNLDAVLAAIENLHHAEGLALGARRFTISTVGLVPGIERLARQAQAVGLAISLHAPDDALRDRLIPINHRYPLRELLKATRFYIERHGRRVTFEYVLLKDVNDSDDHARRTAALLGGLLCHVNLIPLNPIGQSVYQPTEREQVLRFQGILAKAHIQTTVRLSRGGDIQAGCGQLSGAYRAHHGLGQGRDA